MNRIPLFEKRRAAMRRGREGSSLVSVVIGVAFLAAIGFTILMVASRYLVTVHVDRNSSSNFYQTEGILAEVSTGLLEYAGDASEAAYNDILENYTKATAGMKETFSKEYLSGVVEKITGHAYTWDDSKVYKVEDGGTPPVQPCEIEKLKELTKVPDAVTTLPGTNLGFVLCHSDKDGYFLTIKNLLIDYTDEIDYRSSIQTDITLRVPDYKFEGDSTLDELKDYIVISDDMLHVTNSNSAGVAFAGNVYTGNEDSGILIDTQNTADFKSRRIISRGSMDIKTGAKVDVSGEADASGAATPGDMWLNGIRLLAQSAGSGSTLSTKLTVNENAYIANDLDIADDNSVVSLSGKYYGYSYNKENTLSPLGADTTTADYSSAILVNGLNTTLKTDGLDKLILAGRTFVSRYDSAPSDIMMGESLAVKSNQIAYLLPDEFIAAGHNPVVQGESEAIYEENLKNDPDIGKYLDSDKPYMANYNSGGYVYFYLRFKDQKSANEYFRQYYEGTGADEDGNEVANKNQLDDRAKTYISTADGTNGMKLSANLYLIAGNIIHNYYAAGGSDIEGANYYDNMGKPQSQMLEDGKKIGQEYVGRQLTLLASGSTGSMRLPVDAQKLVADGIIDFSQVSGVLNKEDAGTGGRIYVTTGDYTVDGTIQKGIIIAKGDVEVQSDFTGLIIAGGKVTTTRSGLNLKSDMVLVGNLIEFARGDEELSKVFRGINGVQTQDPTALTQCISYQNWKKNEY